MRCDSLLDDVVRAAVCGSSGEEAVVGDASVVGDGINRGAAYRM